MRRALLAALCLAVLACGVLLYSLSAQRGPIGITIWHVYGSDTHSPFNDAVAEFNASRGAELGIVVTVTSILGAETIDAPLVSSAHGEPGAPATPDLFTAYPRAALLVGPDRLIDWGEHIPGSELSELVPAFLADGLIEGRQLGLPIAKSTTSIFINQTDLDRFTERTEYSPDLSTWDGVFTAARAYHRETGRHMIHFNDYYTYFLALTASRGGFVSLERSGEGLPIGRLDLSSDEFERAFMPLARAAAVGAINLDDGFGSEFWMTGDIIASVGSSAGLLYIRDFVARPDGSREAIETRVYPFPTLDGAPAAVTSRGTSLWAFKSGDKDRDAAIAEFARWITMSEVNVKFATSSGYMPVTGRAFSAISDDMERVIESERDRHLYRSFIEMRNRGYRFVPLPLYENVADVQNRFEMAMRRALSVAESEYREHGDEHAAARAAMTALLSRTTDISR